jgi:hypothetical protein
MYLYMDTVYEYICSQWGAHAAIMTVRSLTDGASAVCPPSVLWNFPSNIDIAPLIYNQMRDKVWLRSVWPSIYIMMQPNLGNLSWITMVICGFAYYRLLLDLPTILANHLVFPKEPR